MQASDAGTDLRILCDAYAGGGEQGGTQKNGIDLEDCRDSVRAVDLFIEVVGLYRGSGADLSGANCLNP